MASHERTIRDFWDWMQQHGYGFPEAISVVSTLGTRNGTRGLVANQDLPEGLVLFSVPHECILGTDEDGSWESLAVRLVKEMHRAKKSWWSPYLAFLQSAISTHQLHTTLLWTPKELQLLDGTGVDGRTNTEDVEHDFVNRVLPKVSRQQLPIPLLDLRKFKEALSLVMAYSFTMEGGEVVMVPGADLLNHRTGHNNARLFTHCDGTLQMITIRPVKAGEQLWNTYGHVGNEELLRKHGFMDQINPFTRLPLVQEDFKTILGELSGLDRIRLKARLSKRWLQKKCAVRKDGYMSKALANLVRSFTSKAVQRNLWWHQFLERRLHRLRSAKRNSRRLKSDCDPLRWEMAQVLRDELMQIIQLAMSKDLQEKGVLDFHGRKSMLSLSMKECHTEAKQTHEQVRA